MQFFFTKSIQIAELKTLTQLYKVYFYFNLAFCDIPYEMI